MLWPVEWFGWFLLLKKEGSCDLLYVNANSAWPSGRWPLASPARSLGRSLASSLSPTQQQNAFGFVLPDLPGAVGVFQRASVGITPYSQPLEGCGFSECGDE